MHPIAGKPGSGCFAPFGSKMRTRLLQTAVSIRIQLIVTVVWSLCLFALITWFIRSNYRWFTLPFAAMTMASALLSAIAALVNRDRLSRIALRFHGFLVLPWIFGFQWKGGDDGPGHAWLLLGGIGCAVAAVLGPKGIVVPITCVQCGSTTPRAGFATWQWLVSICVFPLGLLSLLVGRKATTCQHCGHSWRT